MTYHNRAYLPIIINAAYEDMLVPILIPDILALISFEPMMIWFMDDIEELWMNEEHNICLN